MADSFTRTGELVNRMFKPTEDEDRDWRLLVLLAFGFGLAIG